MEDKLLELKEQFCKWFCPNKAKCDDTKKLASTCGEYDNCNLCDVKVYCENDFCNYCMVSEYIRFIRDEL